MAFFRRSSTHRSYDLFSAYSYYVPGIGGMFMLLLMLLIGALAGNLLIMLLGLVMPSGFVGQYGMLISYPVMFIPAMLYASVQSRNCSLFGTEVPLGAFSAGPARTAGLAMAVSAATLAAAFLCDPLVRLLPPMPESLKAMFENMMYDMPLWATVLSVSVFAPFFEEWLCRGMVLRGLLEKMSPVWAIVISALVFAFIHMNPWQALPAFILGILFGYVYYRTRSLGLTMLMHCVNNTFSVVLGQIDSLRDAESYADVLAPAVYYGLLAASAAVLLAFILLSLHFRRR